jgi:acyl-CoA hydrolase
MMPEHANIVGNVHGGVIMKMMDETGAISAMRHSSRVCVTVAADSMEFLSPVHLGQLLCCRGHVTWVGTTSIEVEVQVHAEDVITGTVTHTNSGHFVYVALDDQRRPTPVPRLVLESDVDKKVFAEAEIRRTQRPAQGK